MLKKLKSPGVDSSPQILKLSVRRKSSSPGYFHVELRFRLPPEDEFLVTELLESRPVLYVDDYEAHKAERELMYRLVEEQGYSMLEVLNVPEMFYHDWKRGYAPGFDAVHKQKNGVYVFKEYVTSTPVTEAALKELLRMKSEPGYSVRSSPSADFCELLVVLHRWWD